MGQASSIDTPEEEFYRPRTPLRFGSVPTALPVDPRDYNIREREGSISGASVSSFNGVFPAILSQESFLDRFDDECASPFSPSTFSDSHEGSISPLTRNNGSPRTASLKDTHSCRHDGCECTTARFQTEEEFKDHNCPTSHGSSANTPAKEEFADDIPFYFFPSLCVEENATPAKPRASPDAPTTKSRRTLPQLPQLPQPPKKPPITKRRKITPPPALPPAATAQALPLTPSRSNHSPRRRTSKTKITRPSTPLPQQWHQPVTQYDQPQYQRRASSPYLPPTQYATTEPQQSQLQSASLPATNLQAPLWQVPASFAAVAVTGMQALPMQYEWQQLPHMQQQQLVPSQVGQQGPLICDFLPPTDTTYGVY
ncbi:MAG: hypothetical protein M1813_004608 [Trichoglossum hirsutum]|nr:MAG: hypothetical protein M1813_004608 [Trichoglossum hirsutum]